MYLQSIQLRQFKNYESLELEFSPQINSIVGENGSGKTNLLDAIYYLSIGKSAFNALDSQNILHEQSFFSIQGEFQKENSSNTIRCVVQTGKKKLLKVNQNTYQKISEHLGKFPVVLIAPNDTDLITLGSELRRNFFDSLISHLDFEYLQKLIQYNHWLKQRNSLLKQQMDGRPLDNDLLETYNLPMLEVGKTLNQNRTRFIQEFQPIFQKHYQFLTSQKEKTNITYRSQFSDENYEKVFRESLRKDMILQRTNVGIHRDDYDFEINSYPLKKFGSQGQQKSFVIALKLAQFEILKKHKNLTPILLLDDIFDKLDDERMAKLVEMVAQSTFGQIFITDARPERTLQVFKSLAIEKAVFHIEKGKSKEWGL